MPYTINKTNGDVGATVADGTVDSTFAIKLIGKNYAGYGEIQNENFLALLENFSGSEPARKIDGQIWYDFANKKLKFYDATNAKWKLAGGAEVKETAPTGLVEGDFWWKQSTKQLYAKNSAGEFTLVGPQAAGDNQTEMFSTIVNDDNFPQGSHPIIAAIVDGVCQFVISADPDFTLDETTKPDFLTGFNRIHRGITLAYLLAPEAMDSADTDYGRSAALIDDDAWRFFGTASDANQLGGVPAENYVRNDQESAFANRVAFSDAGYTVGDNWTGNGLLVDVSTLNNPLVRSTYSRLTFQTNGIAANTPLILENKNILPGTDGESNIGSGSYAYNNVYANFFIGTSTQSEGLMLSGIKRLPSKLSTPNTVAVRDDDGYLTVAGLTTGSAATPGEIIGTWTLPIGSSLEATYADLAEKYLTDEDYEIGTVLMVGGSKELTACQPGSHAVGPVSEFPAFMMNKDLDGGVYVAVKGRVPVKVEGPVVKGQRLISGNNGSAQASENGHPDVFAIALESNSNPEVKLVEAIIL